MTDGIVAIGLSLIGLLGLALLLAAASYALLCVVAVGIWRMQRMPNPHPLRPPVTLLKPLCGGEPGLYENLRSFCLQDYPRFQLVFGVLDAADPALRVVERLIAEFPHLEIDVVADPTIRGTNRKIATLINMMGRAKYDVFAVADSDARVGPDYLATVTAPLLDRQVGLVTCLYRGVPTAPLWSRIGAMYVNDWYVPCVLVAWLFGHRGFVSGQTLCLRRDTLEAIGGMEAVVNHLADDHRIGELVREAGQDIVLSRYLLEAEHHEPTFRLLASHELRWQRTLRILKPRSFAGLFLSFPLPLAGLGLVLTAAWPALAPVAWAALCVTACSRILLHFSYRLGDRRSLVSDLWLLPVRDALLLAVWVCSFFSLRVMWRGAEFSVAPDGIMRGL